MLWGLTGWAERYGIFENQICQCISHCRWGRFFEQVCRDPKEVRSVALDLELVDGYEGVELSIQNVILRSHQS